MAVKVNSNMYPYTEQVKNLPVFLTGIGGTEYQGHVKRSGEVSWAQILYCIKGSGCLKYDNVAVDITPGNIFYIPKGKHHEYYPYKNKWEVRWIVFDGKDLDCLIEELGLRSPAVAGTDDLSAFNKLFDKMFITLKADKIYGNYLCSGLAYQFIMEFHRLVLNMSVSNGNIKNEILMTAIGYIENHFRDDFSVVDLAEYSGVSQQYLGRIFRQSMNTSPAEYIVNRRIREAKRLLMETDKRIAEVSQICGFSSAGYFCTVFKKAESISPGKYRSNTYQN